MNYRRVYNQLIQRARTRSLDGYCEKHHILPRCMGGNDAKDNIVKLTAKEHFLAHKLLVRIYPKNKGVWFALIAMGRLHQFKSRIFSSERETAAFMRTGFKYSEESKKKMSLAKANKPSVSPETTFKKGSIPWNIGKFGKDHHLYGKKRTAEQKKKMSEAMKKAGVKPPSQLGRVRSKETCLKIKLAQQARHLNNLMIPFDSF